MATVEFVSPAVAEFGVDTPVYVLCKTDAGAPGTALTVSLAVYDITSGIWYNGAGAWQVAKVTFNLLELDAVDLPGVYYTSVPAVEFDASTRLFLHVTSNAGGSPWSYQLIDLRYTFATQPVIDAAVADPVVTLGGLLVALKAFLTHNQSVDDAAKRLVIFREDGVTAAIQFDLKDAAGLPGVREPFRTERV